MSIISDAFLHNLLKSKDHVVVFPASMFNRIKNTDQEDFNESFIKRIAKKKQIPTTVIPSPVPG